ncbi:MAG: putative protein of unknown function DUF523 [Magnetococcales bacterium]|nr:putative protein of unknown function DUF523 [Magnetococcales bacterium]HIJ85559.1 DUF523 and DUF1722 domain-containing protein [Magnetococcales bacterium]
MDLAISLGVSACLLGEPVRYDGQDKLFPWIPQVLARFFRLVPVCPEVQAGMGTPRPPMHLVGEPSAPSLMTRAARQDMTPVMASFCADEVRRLASLDLRGFIFKSRSPSCGVDGVEVSSQNGTGAGLFANAFRQTFPLAVVVEETRLATREQRQHFIERIFVLDRWQRFLLQESQRGVLSEFHARHKFQIMARDDVAMRHLGRLAADSARKEDVVVSYGQILGVVMAREDTLARHVDCMMHLYGFIKNNLTTTQKKDFLRLWETCRQGDLAISEPRSWLQLQAQRLDHHYLLHQWYLFPDKREEKIIGEL